MNPKELKKPNVSEDLAKDLVLRVYGLKIVSMKRMVSYDDQNYHIQVSEEHQNPYINNITSAGYTFKITNTAKSALQNHFDSMHTAMIHVHKQGVRVPLPVMNKEGKTWKLEGVPLLNEGAPNGSGKLDKCGIHLLTFLPGQPVSTVTYTRSLLYQWGNLLSRFHNAIEDFNFPSLKSKTIFWNLEHVPEIKPFMEGLDREKTNLVTSVLNQYSEQFETQISKLRKGFIHGDFNENNILCQITESKECIVDGVLDFEDMHYGTYAWDVGIMLAYSLLDCKTLDPLEGAGHALAGYLKNRSLDELELSSLKMCIACRLCQSLVMGAYSHRLDPSNSYLIVSARTGWDRLKQVWNTKDEDLLKMWKNIQNMYNCHQQESTHKES